MEKGKMRRSVKKAAAFLLAFALVFSMAGSGRMVVSAQQAAETAAGSVEEKAQVLPSQQNVGTQDENGGTPQENVQNEEPQPGGETPSGSEGGTEDENGPSDQGQNTDENGGETPSGENPSEDNSSEKPSGDEPAPADPSEDTSDKEDGKDPSGVTDGKEEPSTDGTSGTEGGTTDGSSDDQTVSGNDVPEEEAPGEDAGENASEGSVSGNSVSANRIPSGQMAANGIAAMAISGSYEVPVGETITLRGTDVWTSWDHAWNSQSGEDGGDISLFPKDDEIAEVTGKAEGTVTVTHTYKYLSWGREKEGKDTFRIKVLPAESGEKKQYNLYMYTLIPGQQLESTIEPNDKWNGMGVGKISGLGAPSSHPTQTVLDDGYGSSGAVIDYHDYHHDTDTFPDITYNDTTYRYAATDSENANEAGYYTIEWVRVVVDSGANAGNNGYNPVVNDEPTYHLDGVVNLNIVGKCTVHFSVKDAGADEFLVQTDYSKIVEEGFSAGNLKRPDQDSHLYPQQKVVGGITYTFDGWYRDESCSGEKVDWKTETITEDITYYARYIPAAQNIIITKEVSGGLGDVQKEFEFTYSYTDADGNKEEGDFTLADGQSSNSLTIPVGAELTLTEKNAGGYTVSALYGETSYTAQGDEDSQTKTLIVTIQAGANNITVTNNKEVTPDTGILLDSAPHVLGLLLVTAGAAALLTGRRKEHLS